jgi:hypothetical protein
MGRDRLCCTTLMKLKDPPIRMRIRFFGTREEYDKVDARFDARHERVAATVTSAVQRGSINLSKEELCRRWLSRLDLIEKIRNRCVSRDQVAPPTPASQRR